MNTCLTTPIIFNTDIVIFGGGLAALSAGLTLAESKKRVLLIVKETFLLEDVCLPHFYVKQKNGKQNPLFDKIFNKPDNHPDLLKLHAEDLLIRAGIDYLYAAMPLDVTANKDGTQLLRIAGKFGIHAIKCRKVIDLRILATTQDRIIIHAMNGPEIVDARQVSYKTHEGRNHAVLLRPGSHGKGHITLDIPLVNLVAPDTLESKSHAQEKQALEAFKWIKETNTDYAQLDLGRFAGGVYSSNYDVHEQIKRGILAASKQATEPTFALNETVALPDSFELRSYNSMSSYQEAEEFKGSSPYINNLKRCEVVVVGGGTAGTMAALYAARQGAKTVLVEFNHKLGGTATVGGVSTYWFGKRFNETVDVDKRISLLYETLGITRKQGIWSDYDDFNPDLKAYTLMEMCEEAGVEVLTDAISFAAICEKGSGKRVKGIAAVTPNGILAVLGEYVIDATGDGDIAAFCNADFDYGSNRDAITFWASLAQYTSPKEYKNNFSSTVVVSDLKDYTRFISAGRRRGENLFDHGTYVAPRESRHIKGLYEVTLKDVISFKEYEDTLYTCFSNYDPKGKLDADIIYAGVLPPQNAIAVPLRSLIPVDKDHQVIEGLLVAGKAFSCTHNAFPGLRMQPDLQHQGAVLGIMVGEAISEKVSPLNLDTKKLQHKIIKETGDSLQLNLGKRMKTKDLVAALSNDMRLEWTDFPFEQEVKELPISIAIMVAPSKRILPVLEKRYIIEKDYKTKLILARTILWHGSDSATEILLEHIMKQLHDQDDLPQREGSMMCVQLLPDHGVMAELVYKLNLLAWSKRTDVYKPFLEVLKKLTKNQRDYWSNRKSHYHYIESFAYVAERTGLPEFIPMLKSLLQFREFQGLENQTNNDILTERHLILQLSLYRALARCGDLSGFDGLMSLLNHSCASIATSACMELKALTGKPWGKKIKIGCGFIHSEKFVPPINPITQKIW